VGVDTMLVVSGLTAGYGDIIAVRDFSFSLARGRVLAVMGANGAGKSSTLMCLMGLVERKSGSIRLEGEEITTASVETRIVNGLAIVPEGRRVFPDLTLRENLLVGGHILSKTALSRGLEMVFDLFPQLGDRSYQLAGSLSGGEQQMLAIGRALVSRPKILIIDEISLGLMPKVVDECYRVLEQLIRESMAVLLVEQNTERALSFADDVCVLEAGNLIWSGSAQQARDHTSLTASLMGIH